MPVCAKRGSDEAAGSRPGSISRKCVESARLHTLSAISRRRVWQRRIKRTPAFAANQRRPEVARLDRSGAQGHVRRQGISRPVLRRDSSACHRRGCLHRPQTPEWPLRPRPSCRPKRPWPSPCCCCRTCQLLLAVHVVAADGPTATADRCYGSVFPKGCGVWQTPHAFPALTPPGLSPRSCAGGGPFRAVVSLENGYVYRFLIRSGTPIRPRRATAVHRPVPATSA